MSSNPLSFETIEVSSRPKLLRRYLNFLDGLLIDPLVEVKVVWHWHFLLGLGGHGLQVTFEQLYHFWVHVQVYVQM